MDIYKKQKMDASNFMYGVANEGNFFQLREGDGRLASIERLLPDFYYIFTENAKLAYIDEWDMFESFLILVPMAVLILVLLISLSRQVAQIALDVLISVSVSCWHIWQHGIHLSEAAPTDSPEGVRALVRELSMPLRLLHWLRWQDRTDRLVGKAWDVMRLNRQDNRVERLRQLACCIKRMRDERANLQRRRSTLNDGLLDNRYGPGLH